MAIQTAVRRSESLPQRMNKELVCSDAVLAQCWTDLSRQP